MCSTESPVPKRRSRRTPPSRRLRPYARQEGAGYLLSAAPLSEIRAGPCDAGRQIHRSSKPREHRIRGPPTTTSYPRAAGSASPRRRRICTSRARRRPGWRGCTGGGAAWAMSMLDVFFSKGGRNVPQVSSALFFSYNTALGPPYRVIVDTNFINFSIQNKDCKGP